MNLPMLKDFLKIISVGTPVMIVDHDTNEILLNTEAYSSESTLTNVRIGVEYKVINITLSGWYLMIWVDGKEV